MNLYNAARLCGISVIVDSTTLARPTDVVERMHAVIPHRGPDDERALVIRKSGAVSSAKRCADLPPDDVVAAFAFRRLKIIDLTDAAAQPMSAPSGMTWIVFNGEIYNFRQLRHELETEGHSFRSRSDTEVILAAYETWGVDCFARLEGMWAIVIADLRARRIVASRDRFGIKPLYWARLGTSLLFSSEIRQIVAVIATPRPNESRVALHLRGTRFPTTEETFIDGIRSMPPATYCQLSFDDSSSDPHFRPYWSLPHTADISRSYDHAREEFASLFYQAIRTHRVADVGLGCLLSGGLDSSTVTAVLASIERAEGREVPTYSFGFPAGEFEKYSELGYVEAMVKEYGLRNYTTTFDGPWVARNVERVIETIEEPALALPVLAQFRVFELCRQHGTTVVLDGQGADEILAGYPYHQRTLAADYLRHGRPLAFFREIGAIAASNGVSAGAMIKEFFVDPLRRRVRRKTAWIHPNYGRHGSAADFALVRANGSSDPSALNRRLHFDLRWGNAKIILGYADRNAMAHSIEARVPFFDRRLVELAYTLPGEFKTSKGERKRILRDFARHSGVPRQITERADRMGFGTPDAELIRGPLRKPILERINDPQFSRAPCFVPERLRELALNFERGTAADLRAIWRIYTLAIWSERFHIRWT